MREGSRSRHGTNAMSPRRRRSRSGRRREGEKNDATEKEAQSIFGKRTRRRARRDKKRPQTRRKARSTAKINLERADGT